MRVAILLTILGLVLLYAWRDVRMRAARNEWDHTLYVAIVLVRVEPIDDAAIAAMRERVPALEDRLASELARYRSASPRPFRFNLAGPVDAGAPPPAPPGEGAVDLAKHTYALSQWLNGVDERAGVVANRFDARVYVTIRRPRQAERTLVEGRSEQGGRIAVVDVELDAEVPDLPLIVAAHELMHTLGATDKYDAQGRTLSPRGLAEPDRSPPFPQRFTEIMARNRPVSPSEEKVPDGIHEIAVGPVTAREIGWTR
ncbi:MAG: hypothetical protein KF819_28395 [Labilithrix sp.]|nr:hypothetical protein [Labilithrix sp.]